MKTKKKVPAAVPFESTLDKYLKGMTQNEITAYLNACLGDGDEGDLEAFFRGLHHLARAKGIKLLAENTDKTRDTLYKMFSGKNPTLDTFRTVLRELNLDIGIVRRKHA